MTLCAFNLLHLVCEIYEFVYREWSRLGTSSDVLAMETYNILLFSDLELASAIFCSVAQALHVGREEVIPKEV